MKLERFNSLDQNSINAALKVLKSGKLSPFVGNWKNDKIVGSFYGGKNVQKLEEHFRKKFKVNYAIAVNSWTSGLICAVGAIDTKPGDEIIVSTWTMCASATAILHWMAVPVFADIDNETFNINLKTIKNLLDIHLGATYEQIEDYLLEIFEEPKMRELAGFTWAEPLRKIRKIS